MSESESDSDSGFGISEGSKIILDGEVKASCTRCHILYDAKELSLRPSCVVCKNRIRFEYSHDDGWKASTPHNPYKWNRVMN